MKARATLPVLAVTLLVAAACQSSPTDASLAGVWTNDDDPNTVLTIVLNTGGLLTPAPEFSGTLVGELLSPSSPGRLLIDVQRDALSKPLFVIPSYAQAGFKDILCEGCNVSAGHMTCSDAFATTTNATGAVVTLGLSCSWTLASVPGPCLSASFAAYCAAPSCPSWTGPRCGGGLCQASSVCTSASTCQCEPGFQLACCDGTPCPSTGCLACSGGVLASGCAASPPLACSDDVTGSSGVCQCASGKSIPFACGASGTCEQICSGTAPDAGVDANPTDSGFVFDASLPESGFGFDTSAHESGFADSEPPVDAAPCSPAKCGGCCMGGFCYNGTSSDACGQGGQACMSCAATETCAAGFCQ